MLAAWRWMPWERTRARRLLDKLAEEDRAGLTRVMTTLKGNQQVLWALQFAHDERTQECVQTTIGANAMEGNGPSLASLEFDLEVRRRATRLVLWLVAYRLE